MPILRRTSIGSLTSRGAMAVSPPYAVMRRLPTALVKTNTGTPIPIPTRTMEMGETNDHGQANKSARAQATTVVARRRSSRLTFSSARFAFDSSIVRGPAPYSTTGMPAAE